MWSAWSWGQGKRRSTRLGRADRDSSFREAEFNVLGEGEEEAGQMRAQLETEVVTSMHPCRK